MGYSRKKPNGGGGRVVDMEFPGALKKDHLEILLTDNFCDA